MRKLRAYARIRRKILIQRGTHVGTQPEWESLTSAAAAVQGRHEVLWGKACESSRRGELRRWVGILALAAVIHGLVITDPLVVGLLLRGGRDSSLVASQSSKKASTIP
jgi:hypothetical protein